MHPIPPSGATRTLVTLTTVELEALLQQAAERGARQLLMQLGFGPADAAHDIGELRDLLQAWRDARKTAWKTAVRLITTGLLALLLLGVAIKLKLIGGGS